MYLYNLDMIGIFTIHKSFIHYNRQINIQQKKNISLFDMNTKSLLYMTAIIQLIINNKWTTTTKETHQKIPT